MTKCINICLVSRQFERMHGIKNFTKEYGHLVEYLNYQIDDVNYPPYRRDFETMEEYDTYKEFYEGREKLFRKLVRFFDDFNAFITESLITKMDYNFEYPVSRRFKDFIRRMESMNISTRIKDIILHFLKLQYEKYTSNILSTNDIKSRHQNPKKQEILLSLIAETWQKYPMLTLGQLLYNVLPKNIDIFYVSDEKLVKLFLLKKFS